jgi:hypothetical protein
MFEMLIVTVFVLFCVAGIAQGFLWSGGTAPTLSNHRPLKASKLSHDEATLQRRQFLVSTAVLVLHPTKSIASDKCSDIDSCRELGEQKIRIKEEQNPTIKLPNGVRAKQLRPPLGGESVQEGSVVDLAFSITANGGYLYSQGMGYEKLKSGQNDMGLDSIRVVVGKHMIPTGIEEALIGMKRGERRRIELPPQVGFETSNWQPKPNNPVAQKRLDSYKRLLEGNSNVPGYPAVSIWDVEVLKVRS